MSRWDSSLRNQPLDVVLSALYAHEVNCGLSSFWDGGWSVWIGDDMNGLHAKTTFDTMDFSKIAAWLVDTAEDLYPALKDAA